MKVAVLDRVISVGLTKVIYDPRTEGSKGVKESCGEKSISVRRNGGVVRVETCLVCIRDRQGDLRGDRDERLGAHSVGFWRPLGDFQFYSQVEKKQFKHKNDLNEGAILNIVLRIDQ